MKFVQPPPTAVGVFFDDDDETFTGEVVYSAEREQWVFHPDADVEFSASHLIKIVGELNRRNCITREGPPGESHTEGLGSTGPAPQSLRKASSAILVALEKLGSGREYNIKPWIEVAACARKLEGVLKEGGHE